MDEWTSSGPEPPQVWTPAHAGPGRSNELPRCRALATLQRWAVMPAMEEMSLYD